MFSHEKSFSSIIMVWVLERVTIKNIEKNLLKNIKYENWVSKQEELVVRIVRKFKQSTVKFICSLK